MKNYSDTTLPLSVGNQYHVFNQGNNGQNIFFIEKNYEHFLRNYAKYMGDYWETYSYALLPNHFHLNIKVKSQEVITEAAIKDFPIIAETFLTQFFPTPDLFRTPDLRSFQNFVNLTPTEYQNYFQKDTLQNFQEKLFQWLLSERFRRFLMSYAKGINKQENRKGSLFQKLFRRKLIEEKAYLIYLIIYHHRNPIHHGRALTLNDCLWTSYHSFLSKSPTKLERTKVLALFGGEDGFIETHNKEIIEWKNKGKWYLEE